MFRWPKFKKLCGERVHSEYISAFGVLEILVLHHSKNVLDHNVQTVRSRCAEFVSQGRRVFEQFFFGYPVPDWKDYLLPVVHLPGHEAVQLMLCPLFLEEIRGQYDHAVPRACQATVN